MQLENKSYRKDFRNLIIENLELKKNQLLEEEFTVEDEELTEIDKNIFILTNGLTSEYDKINVDFYDAVSDRNEINVDISQQVTKILELFFELEGYLNTDEIIRSHANSNKLKFKGFNDHDDGELDNGQVVFAEYLIMYQKKFQQYKDEFREGRGSEMEEYIEALSFFHKKPVSKESILEFLEM